MLPQRDRRKNPSSPPDWRINAVCFHKMADTKSAKPSAKRNLTRSLRRWTQRWAYRVDPRRPNAYGFVSAVQPPADPAAAAPAVAPADGAAAAAPAAPAAESDSTLAK